MKLRGLFVSAGGFSLVNEQLKIALSSAAPDFAWMYFDAAHDTFTGRPGTKLICYLLATARFAPVMAKHRLPPCDLMIRLPYFQRLLTRALAAAAQKTDFTLQTQSLFDASIQGTPNFLYTDHTYMANRRYDPPRKTWPASEAWLRMEKALYNKASVCFTSSRFAADSIVEDYRVPRERVEVVYSGCNTDLPSSAPSRDRLPRRILFVGVEWERKGGPDLLEAFKTVKQRFPEALLDIVGCSPFVADTGINVHGRVDCSRIPSLLEQADIFCLPSTAEPSAVALVEASAHGLPVVATRVGGTPERVVEGSTGLLVAPSDAKALAAALCRLMEDGDLARAMGMRGRDFALREFTWIAVAQKIARRLKEELS